jgi:hypothetical protein
MPVSWRFCAVSDKTPMKISNFGIPNANFGIPNANFGIPKSKLDEGSRKSGEGRFGRRKGSFARYFPARKTFPHINEQLAMSNGKSLGRESLIKAESRW